MNPQNHEDNMDQLPLFPEGEMNSGVLELFPTLWKSTEDLSSPDQTLRNAAVAKIEALNAARLSPLVAYMLATRIADTDMEVRLHVIKLLGDILIPDEQGKETPEIVRHYLTTFLSQMRTRQIYALLEVLALHPELEAGIYRLLNSCSYTSNHLLDIFNSRRAPIDVRRWAIRFLSRLGNDSVVPVLERHLARLEAHLDGQQAMPFVNPESGDETVLIPEIEATLSALRGK